MYWEPLTAFTLTLIFTSIIREIFKKSGIVGLDIHKPEKPEVAEMGGLAVLISVLIVGGFYTSVNGLGFQQNSLIIILLIGLIGIIDDLTEISQRYKVLFTLLASIPIINSVISTRIDLVFISMDFAQAYFLLAILGIIGAANAINMLAGFNGLEVGLSLIILTTLTILSYLNGYVETAILGLIFAGSTLALLIYNIYPATIFPGDTGTLTMGAMIATVSILGKVEIYGAILIIPHIIDFLLKTKIKFSGKEKGPTQVNEKGKLSPPPYQSILSLLIKKGINTEKKLITTTYLIEILLSIITITIFQLKPI